jgi:hypothetical protein
VCAGYGLTKLGTVFEARDIRVYTERMKVVKVRRVGNSNVVSLPRELEARGYEPGTSVLIEELEGASCGSCRPARCTSGSAAPADASWGSTPRR